jgi:putative transcriptional regulator
MRHRTRIISALALGLSALAAAAQEPEPGQLLVANPADNSADFAETVLLIVHHAEDGSLAVALNRPTWVSPEEAFPEVPDLARYSDELYFGGPMAPNQLLVVFESDSAIVANSRPLIDGVFITVDLEIFDSLAPAAEGSPRVRLFAGHSAWNPGQLEAEINAGRWRVLPAQASQVFDTNPEDLWQRLPIGLSGVTASLR